MTSLESLVHDATARLEALRVESTIAEARARECLIEAEKAAAYVEGLRAAQSLSATPRVRARTTEEQSSRSRDLSKAWKLILHTVHDNAEGGSFTYDDLDRAARTAGHESSRETLRSQMSLYKGRGLIDAEGGGAFTLTPAGVDAIQGVAVPKPEPQRKPVFGGGKAFSNDLDDDAPF